jgi:adenylate cyclase
MAVEGGRRPAKRETRVCARLADFCARAGRTGGEKTWSHPLALAGCARMRSRFALRSVVLPVLLCFGGALALDALGWLQRLENLTLDLRTVWRAKVKPMPAPEDVVLVAIDEESLRAYGSWPWGRERAAELSRRLGAVLPSVVTWDILFSEPAANPAADGALAAGFKATGGTVVLAGMRADGEDGVAVDAATLARTKLQPLTRIVGDVSRVRRAERALLPVAELSPGVEIGFADTPPDPDGIRRVAPLVVQIAGRVYPTLALQTLLQHWGMEPKDVEVRLGEALVIDNGGTRRRVPIDATGGYRVNYRFSIEHGNVAAVGFSGLVSDLKARFEEKRRILMPELTGKILLVGQTAEGLADMGPTPFSPLTPLVLVHTNVLGNILAEDYARTASRWWIWLAVALVGAVGVAFLAEKSLWWQGAYSFGVPVVYCGAATAAWMQGSWLVPVVGPLGGFGVLQVYLIARRVVAEQRAKEQIKGMFGSYVSPELVKRLVDRGEMPRLGGHVEEITAYFSDIQGFSTFSEILSPERLVELMNEYLTVCTDIVQEEGGTLDKYIGDAVVAMFGAPIALPDHAYRACVATQRVQRQLLELRAKWQAEGDRWPEIVFRMQSRIGLNSGRCVIGNMGSRSRFNYTMMGDDVNLAARMESGAKAWGAYSMCTDATRLACEQHGGDRVVFRPLGRIVVKGRERPVPIHEIVGLKEFVTPPTRECIGVFAEGLDRYFAREWEAARQRFARSAQLEPNQPASNMGVASNPSLVYLDIVEDMAAHPPPEDWDGVYLMRSK